MATLSQGDRKGAARQATRAALLAATVELLGEGTPFAEIGIEQIVRRAGFSRPTFYTYFRDKRELVLCLGEAFQEAAAEAADPWLTFQTGQARASLVTIFEAFRAHRETLVAITEAATYDPQVTAFWRAFHERFAATATARVAAGDPSVDQAHAAARAYAMVLMTIRVIAEHLADPTREEEAILDELTYLWHLATGGPATGNAL